MQVPLGRWSIRIVRLFLLCAGLLLVGCQTTDSKSKALATLEAHDRSMESLGEALKGVFRSEGFTPLRNTTTDYIFERPAGTMSNIIYGSLLNPEVWTRVKVHLVPVDSRTVRLSADAFRIRDHGESLEEEERLRSNSSYYRHLLELCVRQAAPGPVEETTE